MGQTTQQRLMQSVIKIVAENGLENTTTKKVAALSGVSEVTLFRVFQNKNRLIFETFAYAEDELCREILSALPILSKLDLEQEIRCRQFFAQCWKYLMEHLDFSQFYLRFYHSAYFAAYKEDRMKTGQQSLIERVQSQLKGLPDNRETKLLLTQLLDTVLNFASRVAGGEWKDDDETAESVFQLLASLVKAQKKSAYRTPHRNTGMRRYEREANCAGK
jgi:AcrR family transcriptional regulator